MMNMNEEIKEVLLDGEKLCCLDAVHAFLRKELAFPDYYGANLDALYDCLSTLSVPTALILRPYPGKNWSFEQGKALNQTLLDAAAENNRLSLWIETGNGRRRVQDGEEAETLFSAETEQSQIKTEKQS